MGERWFLGPQHLQQLRIVSRLLELFEDREVFNPDRRFDKNSGEFITTDFKYREVCRKLKTNRVERIKSKYLIEKQKVTKQIKLKLCVNKFFPKR